MAEQVKTELKPRTSGKVFVSPALRVGEHKMYFEPVSPGPHQWTPVICTDLFRRQLYMPHPYDKYLFWIEVSTTRRPDALRLYYEIPGRGTGIGPDSRYEYLMPGTKEWLASQGLEPGYYWIRLLYRKRSGIDDWEDDVETPWRLWLSPELHVSHEAHYLKDAGEVSIICCRSLNNAFFTNWSTLSTYQIELASWMRSADSVKISVNTDVGEGRVGNAEEQPLLSSCTRLLQHLGIKSGTYWMRLLEMQLNACMPKPIHPRTA